jgi:hypothetical protein
VQVFSASDFAARTRNTAIDGGAIPVNRFSDDQGGNRHCSGECCYAIGTEE